MITMYKCRRFLSWTNEQNRSLVTVNTWNSYERAAAVHQQYSVTFWVLEPTWPDLKDAKQPKKTKPSDLEGFILKPTEWVNEAPSFRWWKPTELVMKSHHIFRWWRWPIMLNGTSNNYNCIIDKHWRQYYINNMLHQTYSTTLSQRVNLCQNWRRHATNREYHSTRHWL